MRRTIKVKTPSIAVSKTAITTLAVALIASCLLPFATSASFKDTRKPMPGVGAVEFELPVAMPVAFLAFSRELNIDPDRPNFNLYATSLIAAPAPFPEADTSQRPNKFDVSGIPSKAASIAPALQIPTIRQIDGIKRFPKRAALHVLPRNLDTTVDRVSFDTPTLAPMSFVRFCMKNPGDCTVHKMAFRPQPVELTKERMAELSKVTRDVNRAISPQANRNGVIGEEWRISPREGDCKDYAVTKRHELLARGWPSRSLLLAEVVVASGEHHLVLIVRTREDDLVLDNLNWNVRSVSQIRYRWVRAQQAGNPKFWSLISLAHGNRVAMNTH
jgi:predicted transglutaminase-like cysteine proteinase